MWIQIKLEEQYCYFYFNNLKYYLKNNGNSQKVGFNLKQKVRHIYKLKESNTRFLKTI